MFAIVHKMLFNLVMVIIFILPLKAIATIILPSNETICQIPGNFEKQFKCIHFVVNITKSVSTNRDCLLNAISIEVKSRSFYIMSSK